MEGGEGRKQTGDSMAPVVKLLNSESKFVNVYGAQESIPSNQFRQPM